MSKSKSSELVRGAGMSATLWQKFEESVVRNNGVPEDLHVLATPEGDPYIDELTKRLVTIGAMQRNAYVVRVNYDLAHDAQIEEAKFDWVTPYDGNLVRKNPAEHRYPVPTGQTEQRITLVHLDRRAKRPEIIAEMGKLNVRPTVSPEFLALTKAYPDLQRKFPLVGLGSVWVDSNRNRHVLYAYEYSNERNLNLNWDDLAWDGDCRFPAVGNFLLKY